MPAINISNIDINFAKYSYTIEEIVDDFFKTKLDEEVRDYCKTKLGIKKIYKSYDLSKVKLGEPSYVTPHIGLNEMYVECAKKVLQSFRKPSDIGLLVTINDNQQYLDPSPTVEVTIRLGLNKNVRTQNFQGMACASLSEALLNAAGHFALGHKSEVLVLIGTYYTSWFLDRIKQIEHISMKNRSDFNNFIYFLIFSDVTAAALLTQSDEKVAQIDTKFVSSRKDTNLDGYKKATIRLAPDSAFRVVFDMEVNSKILRERAAQLCLENILHLKKTFPNEFENVKLWGLHSAGKVFVDYVREKCGIEATKSKLTYELMAETGNTGAASSLQLINESVKRRILGHNELGGIIDYGWDGADAFIYKA
jgi:3-oxoacyl-[acyl-carrier-protein] synthase III